MSEQAVPNVIRETIETADHPELTISEIAERTGMDEHTVKSTAAGMDGLDYDDALGIVRLPDDDGGTFVDDHWRGFDD